jgi:hypothetical protein
MPEPQSVRLGVLPPQVFEELTPDEQQQVEEWIREDVARYGEEWVRRERDRIYSVVLLAL